MRKDSQRLAPLVALLALPLTASWALCVDPPATKPAPTPPTQPSPPPVPPPVPDPAPKPDPAPTPEPMPEPAPKPDPTPQPKPLPDPGPNPAPAPAPVPTPPSLKVGFWRSKAEHAREELVQQHLAPRQQDPLKFVGGDMTSVHADLSAEKTDRPVQAKEERIVRQLDTLIAMLEKQCKGGGGGGPNPSRPLADSVISGGPGGQGEMISADDQNKRWANLPPRQREAIQQSQTEGFPPGYEAILQSYYRRLAQEQTADDPAAADESAAAAPPRPGQP